MCLLLKDEYTGIMVNAFGAPLSGTDRERLAEMVQQGFQKWKEFHDKYGQQQSTIRQQDPGLATWEDLAYFLEELAGAKPLPGYKRQRFARDGKQVKPVEEEAAVVRLADGNVYVCAEYGEFLVYGPEGEIIPKLGLNIEPVADAMRRFAFPQQPVGAAYLRWPSGEPRPAGVSDEAFGVLVFARQTLQMDRMGGWVERRTSLHAFVTTAGGVSELIGREKGHLLRGLFRSVIRKTPETAEATLATLKTAEVDLSAKLRRPTEDELTAQVRHAVTPLFAGVVTD